MNTEITANNCFLHSLPVKQCATFNHYIFAYNSNSRNVIVLVCYNGEKYFSHKEPELSVRQYACSNSQAR